MGGRGCPSDRVELRGRIINGFGGPAAQSGIAGINGFGGPAAQSGIAGINGSGGPVALSGISGIPEKPS